MDDAVADRVLGGLLGVGCGDCLGSTTEFEARARTGDDRVTEIVGGGAFGWRPGEPTDDSDLTLAVLRAYEACGDDGGEVLLAACASNFVGWFDTRPRDIGGTTATALRRLRDGVAYDRAGVADPQAQANGSLMRCLPTGLARADATTRRAEAARISALTHASPVCVDACVAYLDVASALVDGAPVLDALAAPAGRSTATPEVDDALRTAAGADTSTAAMPFAGGGWVLTALRIALWAVRQDRPAAEVLLDVVNRGGDADTNGAIAGGLLGCRDGAAAWPTDWTERLELGGAFVRGARALADLRGRS